MPCSRAYRTAPILPSMPRTPNPPGMHDAVDAGERARPRRSAVSQSSLGTQRMLTRASLAKPAARSASRHRQVGVGQVDVLADQRDGDLVLRVVHPLAAGRPSVVQSTSRNGRPSRRTT